MKEQQFDSSEVRAIIAYIRSLPGTDVAQCPLLAADTHEPPAQSRTDNVIG
jgi:hypothetical protein